MLNLAERKPLGSIVKQDGNLRYRDRQGYRPKVFYEISAPVNSPEKIHQPGFMWYDK